MKERARSAFSLARLGALELRNRLVRTAAFEGMCPGGRPSEALVEHHRRVAAGGVALTTVAYCSVAPDGRTYGIQMTMDEAIVPGLRALTDAVHREGAAASIQLGHSGYFSSREVIGGLPLGASRVFNLYGLSFPREMNEDDLLRVAGDFARSAGLAMRAGFDAVELHFGHGYLVSQFLSPYTNRRTDSFGGALENRLRFPTLIAEAVRRAVGPRFPILVKTNLTDGFRGGLGLEEGIAVARRLEELGVDALVLSGGFVSKTSLYMLRGGVPTWDMVRSQDRWWRKAGLALFGKLIVTEYPFTEAFFLEEARAVRAAVRLPLVAVGGFVSRANIDAALAAGLDFVALGRATIRDPDFVRKLERGEIERSDCDHCNRCVAAMDAGGVRCLCRDGEASPGEPSGFAGGNVRDGARQPHTSTRQPPC